MLYKEFVKMNYPKVMHLPAKDRLSKIAEMWHVSKNKLNHSKKEKGAGMMNLLAPVVGLGSMFGLGLKKTRGRPRKASHVRVSKEEHGAGLFGDIGSTMDNVSDMFGLGLKKTRGRPRKQHHSIVVKEAAYDGAGLFDSIASLVGLGMHKKHQLHKERLKHLLLLVHEHGRKHKKMSGGSFFNDMIRGVSQGFNAIVDPALSIAQKVIPIAKLTGAI